MTFEEIWRMRRSTGNLGPLLTNSIVVTWVHCLGSWLCSYVVYKYRVSSIIPRSVTANVFVFEINLSSYVLKWNYSQSLAKLRNEFVFGYFLTWMPNLRTKNASQTKTSHLRVKIKEEWTGTTVQDFTLYKVEKASSSVA